MQDIDELLSIWERNKESGNEMSAETLCIDCPELIPEVQQQMRALNAVDSYFSHASDNDDATTNPEAESIRDFIDLSLTVSSMFRIERLHASGGLGHVFLATDPVLNRKVAIKFPRLSRLTAEQRARFEREARLTGRLDHPGIVPVHSLKQDDPQRPCYVMRFVEGPTLQERISEFHANAASNYPPGFFSSLEFRQLLQNLVALCNIVAYAHSQGIIHRDIKPGNIIPGPFGETLLLDWGLAKMVGEPDDLADSQETPTSDDGRPNSYQTRTGQSMGTPAFASPEQLSGENGLVDYRTDVFAIGQTLGFLLHGPSFLEPASRPKLPGIADKRLSETLPSKPPAIPKQLHAIWQHAVERKRENRYQSVTDLNADLERYLAGQAVSVVRDTMLTRIGRAIRRRPGWAASITAAVLVALVAGLLGSAILGSKNRELVVSNDKLLGAMQESQLANRQTLEALRSLVDEVVVRNLSQQRVLDQQERDFLNRIAAQYSALASLKGDSPENRAIRAEGLMQVGRIHLQLSDEQEAVKNLEAAEEQLQQLVRENGTDDLRLQLASTLAALGRGLMMVGQLEVAQDKAQQGIQLIAGISESEKKQTRTETILARLYYSLGVIQQHRRQWNAAIASLQQSQALLESMLKLQSDDTNLQQTLAAVFRELGSLAAQVGDLPRQIEYSGNALNIQQDLVRQFPGIPEHELGLALAYNNYSVVRETAGQTSAAIGELTEAIDYASRLVEQFPLVSQYRSTLADLYRRRGGLYWIQEQPVLAETDLADATRRFESLVREFADVPEYHEGLLQTLLLNGEINIVRKRYAAGQRNFSDLFEAGVDFENSFPEVAAQSMTVSIARIQNTRLQRVAGQAVESIDLLNQALHHFETISESDHSIWPDYWRARTQMLLARTLRALKQPAAASLLLDEITADLSAMAESCTGKHELLSRLASVHKEVAFEFSSIDRADGAAFHLQRELEIREQIVSELPDNPYYAVLFARALFAQGDQLRDSRNFPAALERYEHADQILSGTILNHPDDHLVQTTMGDLRAREGRRLFMLGDFENAHEKFTEAVRLKPSTENRGSFTHNLAWFRPELVLTQVDAILADEFPEPIGTLSLLRACGVASNSVDDPTAKQALGDRALRVLQRMADEQLNYHPQTIAEFRTGKSFATLRQRDDFNTVVNQLDQLNKELGLPLYIRQLPEPLKSWTKWFSE